MYGSGPVVFAVWGYVIAHAIDSRVELNPALLASTIGSPASDIEAAIAALCQPDPASRNPDEDGRRLIREGPYQFRVVSHEIYRRIRNEEDRRAYNREKQRASRAKRAVKLDVNDINRMSTMSAHTEAEAEAKKSTRKEPRKARPIFKGARLTVFQWQIGELTSMLGPHAEAFDLEEWIHTLDEASRADSLVIADSWEFLKARTLVEAARRGLVSSQDTKPTKEELQTAQRVRQNQFGCRHQPRCVSTDACILAIVKELRAKSYQEAPR